MDISEIKKLKRLPISHLSLIILNEQNDEYTKKFAEIELKNRLKFIGEDYKNVLCFDEQRIKERGLDINNYLFSPNPSMQQLMELYFLYSYNSDYLNNKLLFSERHLCNNMNFCTNFFDKICNIEIRNIENRLETTNNAQLSDILIIFKKALEKRKKYIELEKKKEYYNKTDFNECIEIIFDQTGTLLERCISDEEVYKMLTSNLSLYKNIILEYLNGIVFSTDLTINMYILGKVLNDSSRLTTQKKILLEQAKEGYEVDYTTPSMEKILRKVESIDF